MNKEFKIKLVVRVTLKERDIRDALEHKPWRYSRALISPLLYLKCEDKIIAECTMPCNLDWNIDSDIDVYAKFISGVIVEEGLYEISAYIGDQEVSQRNYVGVWNGDSIMINYTAKQDVLEQINEIYHLWSLLEDNTNSRYTKLFTDYPISDLQNDLLDKPNK